MRLLHKLIDLAFSRFPFLKEFCFLAIPLSSSGNGRMGLFNAALWTTYLEKHPVIPPCGVDSESIKWIRRLVARRKHIRYFLTANEIIRYYQAKRLKIPYWFPDNGTLLKSVFLCKAGTIHVPSEKLIVLRNRIALDGGAASGDSSIALLEAGVSHVFAFEPSPMQREEMKVVFQKNNVGNDISIVPYALGECRRKISFSDQYGITSIAESISIDEYCGSMDIGCIKLDIEGAEFPTLRGAVATIGRCRPILLICAYHRPEDLFEMPVWIHNHFPFYHYCIRDTEPGNRNVGVHVVLIAWPD